MAKFEYKTHFNSDIETIEAADYHLDIKEGKLTFYDIQNRKLATFATDAGAYVKTLGQLASPAGSEVMKHVIGDLIAYGAEHYKVVGINEDARQYCLELEEGDEVEKLGNRMSVGARDID
jgi:hypothetical protein